MSMTGRYLRVSPDQIGAIQRAPSTLLAVLYAERESEEHRSRSLDIDKAWHIIHYLLNGAAWEGDGPLFGAVLGGDRLTGEDLGYGPARFLLAHEVASTAEALDAISAEELWNRFDEEEVARADLYWSMEPDSRSYALENYEKLRDFFGAAARAGDALILWLA